MPKVIFSRPDWNDTATKWGTWWTKDLMDKCTLEKIECYKENAVKAKVNEAIQANPDAFFYGFGHGNETTFAGQSNATVIDGTNVSLFDKAFVHLLSCSVFAGLGKKFKNGSGYNKTYYFYISTHPDGYAEPYFDSDHQYPLAIWEGKTNAEAQKLLKDKYTWWYSQSGPAGKDYLPWDRDCHVITGDPNAKWQGVSGIKRILVYHKHNGIETLIGEMAFKQDKTWEIEWKVPDEGVYALIYIGEDTEGSAKRIETGSFTVTFPPSGINMNPIYPKGGEAITAKTLKLQIEAWYEKP